MIDIEKTFIEGLLLIRGFTHADERGLLKKTFHAERLKETGLQFTLREEFFSESEKAVIRGMHFQIPPHEHTKIVTCLKGQILDVVLDIRKKSPTYGHYFQVNLDSKSACSLWIPPGLAHGFLSLSNGTLVSYKTDKEHSPPHDAGVLWNSFGMHWGVANPKLSPRDAGHPSFLNFYSPFEE